MAGKVDEFLKWSEDVWGSELYDSAVTKREAYLTIPWPCLEPEKLSKISPAHISIMEIGGAPFYFITENKVDPSTHQATLTKYGFELPTLVALRTNSAAMEAFVSELAPEQPEMTIVTPPEADGSDVTARKQMYQPIGDALSILDLKSVIDNFRLLPSKKNEWEVILRDKQKPKNLLVTDNRFMPTLASQYTERAHKKNDIIYIGMVDNCDDGVLINPPSRKTIHK